MINELIDRRWSTRAFSESLLTQQDVEKLLLAASKAPSAFNEQPWRFIVGLKGHSDVYDKVLSLLTDNNRLWASKAPLLIMLLAKRTWSHNGEPNPNGVYDAGQAAAYLTIQATHDNLFVHQMAGFDRQKSVEVLSIDPDFQPMVVIAVGHKGSEEHLPEGLRKLEQSRSPRKKLEELIVRK
ncbi:MAG TPA: nitroreductase family protein [Cytophagaceae bacterium]|jgi:nitroreductase|nr:nitroreductase family protein [Cytophagaceae bacterium]